MEERAIIDGESIFEVAAQATAAVDETPVYTGRAYYYIDFREDGVFLVIDKDVQNSTPFNPIYINFDITRRNIKGVNITSLLQSMRRLESEIKLTGQQEHTEYDSDVSVIISKDAMSAEMMLFPSSAGGVKKTADEILAKISGDWKVTRGIDEAAVRDAVKSESYYRPINIASGLAPVKGKDGYLTFLFNTKHDYSPEILPDGSADFKNLNIFEAIKIGDPLVAKAPPEEGVDGYNVNGETLPAKPGAEAKLPAGKNTKISDDGLTLLAVKSGRVDYINGRVEISDVYRIPGDVDMSVGNVKFEGDVVIGGDIISGLTVEAAGLIEVTGYVEGATLIAGGNIVLKKGIQGGSDKGVLKAGGNIIAKFMENCNAEAKGSIFADYIVHSTVLAQGSITAKGKWGKIIGGLVRAGKEVTANYIGSPSYDITAIEVGNDPETRARCLELETERMQVKAQIQKIDSIARVMPANDTPERQEMRQKLIDTREHLVDHYNELTDELAQCNLKLQEKCGGRVNVLKSVYPNVKITIDSAIFFVKSTTEYATFRNREGEITFLACEVRP